MSRRLLFTGVSTMRDHAGQHKLYFIAEALARKGVPVSVLVPDRRENREFLRARPGIEAHFYPDGSVLSDLRHKARMLGRRSWSAVWIVGVGLRSLTMRGWWARGIPLVKDFDEFPSMIASASPLRREYLRWIERRHIAQVDAFTVASSFLENAVRRRRPEVGSNLLRLPVAISADEHRVRPSLVSQLRSAAAGRPVLLYVGSLLAFYQDQVDELIQLAAQLKRGGSDAVVRIVGGGPAAADFQARARRAGVEGTLEFAGHVDRPELASHLEAANVLLFPFPATPFNLSRCPTKAYHYAASGRPVVTNRTGEVAALLGDDALYYPEHDIAAMADRCLEAMRRPVPDGSRSAAPALTWEARAETFGSWLETRGWLPGSSAGVVSGRSGGPVAIGAR